MKILKKATQKNITLNKNYYTRSQLERMNLLKQIFYFDKDMNECYNYKDLLSWEQEEITLRIFTEHLQEIKVALIDGSYTTIAIDKNNNLLYIEL